MQLSHPTLQSAHFALEIYLLLMRSKKSILHSRTNFWPLIKPTQFNFNPRILAQNRLSGIVFQGTFAPYIIPYWGGFWIYFFQLELLFIKYTLYKEIVIHFQYLSFLFYSVSRIFKLFQYVVSGLQPDGVPHMIQACKSPKQVSSIGQGNNCTIHQLCYWAV